MQETKVGFVSLGCPKATVDSERILTQLNQEGYAIAPDYQSADVVVVNTCGFIDAAVEESLDAIGEAVRENGRVIVTGCLGTRAQLIQQRYPEVLAVTPAHAYDAVMQAVREHAPNAGQAPIAVPPQGVKLTPEHYAYLKISEGCHHDCTFCIIPSMRGTLVSRPIGDILQEAEQLAEAGVKELLVIAQDSSAYGLDRQYRTGFWHGRPYRSDFATLTQALGAFGIWVRLHYVYPYPHVSRVIPFMAEGLILPYLDIPLQHSAPHLLRAMKRPGAAKVLSRLASWRATCPDLTLRSTFIVGFPGETDADFQHLLDFLTAAELDHVGCFTYSPVAGAAANALPGQISEAEKAQRKELLMAHQQHISRAKLATQIGREMTVLIDGVEGDNAVARGAGQAPEIDGCIYLDGYDELPIGTFYDVTITAADDYDLWAIPNAI